jgi:hypothetical protein
MAGIMDKKPYKEPYREIRGKCWYCEKDSYWQRNVCLSCWEFRINDSSTCLYCKTNRALNASTACPKCYENINGKPREDSRLYGESKLDYEIRINNREYEI